MPKNYKLPKKILPIPNADKAFHEKWYDGRDWLNVIHPYRAVILGPPNVGKSCVVKNLILRADPPFQEVIVIHCDPEYTQEYDDIGDVEMMGEVPSPDEFEGEVKTLVILDDLEFKSMNKVQKKNLDRLFGFVSTHKNISCCLCAQDPFNVPPIVRRCSNLWILWRGIDLDSMAMCARKAGLKSEELKEIFNNLMPEFRDSLWLDKTAKTPAPMRKNGYELIEKEKKKQRNLDIIE